MFLSTFRYLLRLGQPQPVVEQVVEEPIVSPDGDDVFESATSAPPTPPRARSTSPLSSSSTVYFTPPMTPPTRLSPSPDSTAEVELDWELDSPPVQYQRNVSPRSTPPQRTGLIFGPPRRCRLSSTSRRRNFPISPPIIKDPPQQTATKVDLSTSPPPTATKVVASITPTSTSTKAQSRASSISSTVSLSSNGSSASSLVSLTSSVPSSSNSVATATVEKNRLLSPSNFVATWGKRRSDKLLVTAYDDTQFGRIFLLAYGADDFLRMLDALLDNVTDFECVDSIPPIGTRVVARVGRDGDERDVGLVKKLGGIHNKPWRGVIKEEVFGGFDNRKAVITFTDLGITEEIHVSDIFIPSDKVAKISFDKFGSWVQVDNFNVRDETRRFYLSKYRNLMDGKFLFRNVKVEKAHIDEEGEVKAIVKLARSGSSLADMAQELQHWNYEKAIKLCAKTPSALVDEMHGPHARIKFDDISRPRCLDIGATYQGKITAAFDKADGLYMFEILGGGDIEDNKRIWLQHVNNYYALTHTNQDRPLFWYPQLHDVFLLRIEVEDDNAKLGTEKQTSVIWRRVARQNMSELWDVDDTTFAVNLDALPANYVMIPAPRELLDLPNGAVRILIPGHKFQNTNSDNELVLGEAFSLKIKSYEEEYLAHVVEANEDFLERARSIGCMVLLKNGFNLTR